MGGEPYWYTVPFEQSVEHTFRLLQEREFKAGRYRPVVEFLGFPINLKFAPGAAHRTIDDARQAAGDTGTRSILDLLGVSREREFLYAHELHPARLTELFGTSTPDIDEILDHEEFWDEVDRGEGACVVLSRDGRPSEVFFAGYSFD